MNSRAVFLILLLQPTSLFCMYGEESGGESCIVHSETSSERESDGREVPYAVNHQKSGYSSTDEGEEVVEIKAPLFSKLGKIQGDRLRQSKVFTVIVAITLLYSNLQALRWLSKL